MKLSIHLKILISFGLIIAGLETAAIYLKAPNVSTALFSYDEETGFANPRSRSIGISFNKRIITHEFTAEGVSDLTSGRGRYTLILGDGITAGVELERPSRIAQRLRGISRKDFVNLSTTGFGTLQHYYSLRKWFDRHPSALEGVVLVFNLGNDLHDSIHEFDGEDSPGFYLNSDSLTPTKPKLPNILYREAANIYRLSRFAGLMQDLFSRTYSAAPSNTPSLSTIFYDELFPTTAKSRILYSSDYSLNALVQACKMRQVPLHIVFWYDARVISSGLKQADFTPTDILSYIFTDDMKYATSSIFMVPDDDLFFVSNQTRHPNAQLIELLAQHISRHLQY